MSRRLILLSFVLFLSCQNGSLTSGIGKSDAYISLIEDMNAHLSLSQNVFSELEQTNSFNSIEVSRIISIDKLDDEQASISVPQFNIDAIFNRTEIIKSQVNLMNEFGEIVLESEIIFVFATKEDYYSESRFPLSELYYFIDAPWNVTEQVSVIYFTEELSLYAGAPGTLNNSNGSGVTFEYVSRRFLAYNRNNHFIGSGNGSGTVRAEKTGEFPGF